MMSETDDDRLWRIARKRANFRKKLFSNIAVVIFLWLVWWFTTGKITGFTGYPWPIWIMLGLGLGLAKQYFTAYKGNKQDLADEEFEKLKRQQEER